MSADPLLFEKLVILLEREQVEQGNLGAQIAAQDLRAVAMATPATVKHYARRLSIGLAGYDDDPRELQEIEEVRLFLGELDRLFPYWFYFCDRSDLWLRTMLLCNVEFRRVGGRTWQPDQMQFFEFIRSHVHAEIKLRERYCLPHLDLDEMFREALNYYTTPQL